MRPFRFLLLAALLALACAPSALAAPTVHIYPAGPYAYPGPVYASASGAMTGFKAALAGFQAVDWDSVPDADAEPYALPPDFFNSQGLALSTPGNSLRVSAAGAHAATVFTDINTTYGGDFAAFSGPRIFSPLGSNVTDVTFAVPGSSTPATVRGFGAMFVNVEPAFTSSIEYFDPSGASLGRYFAGPNGSAKQFSFLGVTFSSEKVARVRITTGTNPLSSSTDDAPPGVNVVALDDFAYADPQKLAGPALTVASPAEGATVTSAAQTVTGTATDPYGVKSLTVNGQLVTVGADGSWSAPITLRQGSNAIAVIATNTGGASTTVTRNVTLAPPPPPAKPSNEFTFRSLKVNPKTGKGLAIVRLPGPGKVELFLTASRPVGRLTHLIRSATAAGDFQMQFNIPKKARKILKTRRAHAVEKVSFTPTGGTRATHSTAVTVGTKH